MPVSKFLLLVAPVVALTSLATAQVAILQIQVVEGDGAVRAPGSRSARPITVEVKDETGKPVEGAAVSFHLPEDGPGGSFPSGLRTAVVPTDARGRASAHGLQANHVPGRFQVRIVASKEQARAGTISFQYVGEPRNGPTASTPSAPHSAPRPVAKTGGHAARWIAIVAVVAGGAAAGLMAGRAGASTPSAPVAPVQPPAPALSIGSPSIVVGHP